MRFLMCLVLTVAFASFSEACPKRQRGRSVVVPQPITVTVTNCPSCVQSTPAPLPAQTFVYAHEVRSQNAEPVLVLAAPLAVDSAKIVLPFRPDCPNGRCPVR